MSEPAQSEVLKTVSEMIEESQKKESQNHQQHSQKPQQHLLKIQPQPVVENSAKSVNSSRGNGPIKSNRITKAVGIGSRAGSYFLPGLHNSTLPSKWSIIIGLCQVGIGGAMVLTGILAIRYQSYLFHYGTGLWAGLLSTISGMLGAMCTKKGVPKPTWLCGGRKWQIHVFLLAIMLSLSSVVLLAIFSTSGLLQDARTIMAVEIEDQNQLDDILDNKNTSGIVINTVLLLLSILQVLLCFSSLGIAVRVLFKSKRSLLSSKGSTGSEVAIRDVGAAEYHARKDHLISWLGNQRPNVIPLGLGYGAPKSTTSSNNKRGMHVSKYPTLVAIQPVMYPAPRRIITPAGASALIQPHPMILSPQFAYSSSLVPQMMPNMIPICAVHGSSNAPSIILAPHNSRRVGRPMSSLSIQEYERHRNRRRSHQSHGLVANNNNNNNILQIVQNPRGIVSNSVKSFETRSRRSSKAPSVISVKTESEKNNEVEITEVDVSRTYTGLDRDIAESYICAMGMNCSPRKESSIDEEDLISERDEEEEEDDDEDGNYGCSKM